MWTITRLLAATGSIKQDGVQHFKPSPLTMMMADPIMEATTRAWSVQSLRLSIMMMVQVAVFGRSEKQWRDLIASVGLTNVNFYQPPGSGEGIVEAIK
ncbi:O-methyltransferase family 2 [Penicillium concentricum]|uniref:O-methyltransferase family 2 n=1 Tax=Penicillium concentricum TaxID=293559 RepID=A0A9W9S8V7_9EURO|nr:O-methyltransferase family 2 [Penicillium concentricum]KAJ5373109.1 O-methyltransferase family 2 [Penicillium concentricum]